MLFIGGLKSYALSRYAYERGRLGDSAITYCVHVVFAPFAPAATGN